MSYRVEYGKNPKYPVSSNRRKWYKVLLVIVIVISGAITGLYFVQTIDLHVLLPGDPMVTGAALDNMIDNLRSGQSTGEAFSVFCKEIITHAQILE